MAALAALDFEAAVPGNGRRDKLLTLPGRSCLSAAHDTTFYGCFTLDREFCRIDEPRGESLGNLDEDNGYGTFD
jgi:hypothetical protein